MRSSQGTPDDIDKKSETGALSIFKKFFRLKSTSAKPMPPDKNTQKPGKTTAGKNRKPNISQSPKRSAGSSKTTAGKKKPGKAGWGFSFPILPLTAAWLLVMVVLSGLIYWGIENGNRDNSSQIRPPLAMNQKQKEAKPPSPPTHTRVEDPVVVPEAQEPATPSHRQVISPEHPTTVSRDNNGIPHPIADTESKKLGTAEDSLKIAPPSPQQAAIPKPHPPLPTGNIEPAAPAAQPPPDDPLPSTPGGQTPEKPTHLAALPPSAATPREASPPPAPRTDPDLMPPMGRVAIVIDDFGQDLNMAKRFLQIPLAITFSVLPHQTHTREIARLAHAMGREVLLHVPMEPKGYPKVNPGTGALLLSMNDDAIRTSLRTALDTSPFFSGVNNHMGSKFTESGPHMEVVLKEVGRNGMFFLDSHTTATSVVVPTARKLYVPTGKRDIFLDHIQTEKFVSGQIDQLIARARTRGTAIAIGHPHECTLKVLRRNVERFGREGIAVVPCSELMTNTPLP